MRWMYQWVGILPHVVPEALREAWQYPVKQLDSGDELMDFMELLPFVSV